jgi:hypothetical protein
MSENIDLVLKATLFNDALYEVEPADKIIQFDDGAFDVKDPIGNFVRKTEMGLLTKTAGLENESWDAPLTKGTAETDPAALPASSQARLQKAFGVIERVFAGFPQECEEAKSIAKRLLIETRAEAMAA